MRDQVKIVELRARRLQEVSRKTARGAVQNGFELPQRYGCRLIEPSGRAAAQDHLLDRVLRPFCFRQWQETNWLAARNRSWKDRVLSAPQRHFLFRLKRGCVVHLQHGGIFSLALR